MSNVVLDLIPAGLHFVETDEERRARIELLTKSEIVKVVGVALTILAVVAAFYAMISGMVIETLAACVVTVFTLDIVKLGTNGVNCSISPDARVRSVLSVLRRIGLTRAGDLGFEILSEGTYIATYMAPLFLGRTAETGR